MQSSTSSRQMTMQQYLNARRPNWPGHTAFALAAISFTVGDVLWLRLLAVGASSCHVVFNYYHPTRKTLWLPMKWNAAFIAINLVWICELLRERCMPLNELEREVYNSFLADIDGDGHVMTPLQCKKLLREAKFDEVSEGSELIQLLEHGKDDVDVILVVRGEPEVRISKSVVVKGKPGLFGEMSFMSGSASSASVYATPGCAYFRWDRANLKLFLEGEPEIARGLEHFMFRAVAHKLFVMNEQRKKEKAQKSLHKLKRVTSRELALLNKRQGVAEVARAETVEPFFRAGLWKLVSGGDRRRSEDWIYLDMWIGKDGTLFYWSDEQKAHLVYWTADDVEHASIRRTDGESFQPYGFQVSPDDDFACAPAEFAADSEEMRGRWIDGLRWSTTSEAARGN